MNNNEDNSDFSSDEGDKPGATSAGPLIVTPPITNNFSEIIPEPILSPVAKPERKHRLSLKMLLPVAIILIGLGVLFLMLRAAGERPVFIAEGKIGSNDPDPALFSSVEEAPQTSGEGKSLEDIPTQDLGGVAPIDISERDAEIAQIAALLDEASIKLEEEPEFELLVSGVELGVKAIEAVRPPPSRPTKSAGSTGVEAPVRAENVPASSGLSSPRPPRGQRPETVEAQEEQIVANPVPEPLRISVRPPRRRSILPVEATPSTEQASLSALRPLLRPSNLAIVSNSPPASSASSSSQAAPVSQDDIVLIGISGTANAPRALVLLPNGETRRLSIGDSLDGGRVAAISDGEVIYQRRGRNIRLRMPR